MASHIIQNVNANEPITGATVAGAAAAGAANGLITVATAGVGTATQIARAGAAGGLGGAIQNLVQQRMDALEEAEFYANGGV